MSERMTAEEWYKRFSFPQKPFSRKDIQRILWDWQNDMVEREALAASRLDLLRRVVEESYFDVEQQTWYWSCNQKEFDEMVKELGE